MRRAPAILLGPVVVAALGTAAACGDSVDDAAGTVPTVITPEQPPATSGAPVRPPTVPTVPARAPASTAPGRTDLPGPPPTLPPGATDVDRALADVVARTGVDVAAVRVIAEDAVTWRDSSIGCPQKGMEYMQVLTEGTRIIVEAAGQRFEYHRGGRRDLFYCAAPHPPVGE